MSGETKKRISDLEVELSVLRKDNIFLLALLHERPTLRDQFAIAALKNILRQNTAYTIGKAATMAYEIADTMMVAREESQ
jgi:hypothetical protein